MAVIILIYKYNHSEQELSADLPNLPVSACRELYTCIFQRWGDTCENLCDYLLIRLPRVFFFKWILHTYLLTLSYMCTICFDLIYYCPSPTFTLLISCPPLFIVNSPLSPIIPWPIHWRHGHLNVRHVPMEEWLSSLSGYEPLIAPYWRFILEPPPHLCWDF